MLLIVCEVERGGRGRGEGERNSELVKWGYRAQRGKGAETERERKKVETDLFYARGGKSGEVCERRKRERKEKSMGFFFLQTCLLSLS